MLEFIKIIFHLQQLYETFLSWFDKPKKKKPVKRKFGPPKTPETYRQLLDLHNDYRALHGLPRIEFNTKFSVASIVHAEYLSSVSHITHKDFDKRVKMGVVAETVIYVATDDTQEVFDKVISNKNRLKVVLSKDITCVGIGCSNGYWVILYGNVI